MWLSYHLHYAGDHLRVVRDCIRPLVLRLLGQDQIQTFFFVRYWEQGSHLRLRFELNDPAQAGQIDSEVRAHCEAYLRQHPTPFKYPSTHMLGMFSDWFISEYDLETFERKYGQGTEVSPSGKKLIPYEINNSLIACTYEPELGRYGGPRGMHLAEQLFQASSLAAMELLDSPNGHDRNYIFGQAMRTLLLSTFATIGPKLALTFFDRNRKYWSGFLSTTTQAPLPEVDAKYERQKRRLLREITTCTAEYDEILRGVRKQPPYLQKLASVTAQLRAGLADGSVLAPMRLGEELASERMRTPDAAIEAFLLSYVHMHSNRCGIAIREEYYIYYLAEQALREMESAN